LCLRDSFFFYPILINLACLVLCYSCLLVVFEVSLSLFRMPFSKYMFWILVPWFPCVQVVIASYSQHSLSYWRSLHLPAPTVPSEFYLSPWCHYTLEVPWWGTSPLVTLHELSSRSTSLPLGCSHVFREEQPSHTDFRSPRAHWSSWAAMNLKSLSQSNTASSPMGYLPLHFFGMLSF